MIVAAEAAECKATSNKRDNTCLNKQDSICGIEIGCLKVLFLARAQKYHISRLQPIVIQEKIHQKWKLRRSHAAQMPPMRDARD